MRELKVAAYCRVSTNHAEQESNLETQISYYKKPIVDHDGWKLIKIYADRASETQIKKHSEFMKMFKACKQGKIDLILIKSISRFGRNTLDTLKTLYELFILGVKVYFEKESLRQHRTKKVCLNCTRFLRYDKDENGRLVVAESEAVIVRNIFELYLNGFGVRKIKKYLEENGIKTVTGKDVWSTSTIDRILSNEKYVGDVLMQKKFYRGLLDRKAQEK